MSSRKIKKIRIVSRIVLIAAIILAGYLLTHPCEGWWLFYFDYNLNYIILLLLFLAALLLEFVSYGLRRKMEAPLAEPKIWSISFLALLFLLFVIFILSTMGGAGPCSWSRDAKIISGLSQARTGMFLIYEENGNFDRVSCTHEYMREACEQVDMFYRANDENISMFSIRRYKKAYDRDGKEPMIVRDSPTNSQGICIYSPLNMKDYWYCVDSTGAAVKTKINPSSPGYCLEGQSAVCPPLGD